MTKREATEKEIAGVLNAGAICEGSLKYKRGIGNERYEIIEFSVPSHVFFFAQEQMILIQHPQYSEKLKSEAVKALIVTIKTDNDGFTDVRCFVKGGYDALGC